MSTGAVSCFETGDYPKLTAVAPLDNYRLRVTFANGVSKVYDCKPPPRKPAFAPLAARCLFRAVQVDPGEYSVGWNEEIDLSESEQERESCHTP